VGRTVVPSGVTTSLRPLSIVKPATSITRGSTGRSSLRRSTAFTRATSSRGEKGFVT